MKFRPGFVSNSSTSSYVVSGEGARVVEKIVKDLNLGAWQSLNEEDKNKLAAKWADWIESVETYEEY